MKRLIIILLSTLSLTAFAQKKVAVYMIGPNSGVNKVLGDKLVTAFAQSGKYIAVERTSSFLSKLSSEQTYQRTGVVSDNEIAALGVQFGVNYVCVVEVTDVFDEQFISARLIDVETAEIVNTYNVNGKINTMNQCVQIANEVASNLTKGTFIEQTEEARIKAEEEERIKVAEETKIKAINDYRNWEEERRKRIEEAQKVAERIKTEQHKGYVDLGLPSGTLWRACNESNEYDYISAVNKFGNKLPTDKHWLELKEHCIWKWNGCGYEITGPNDQSIILPATEIGKGTMSGVTGTYWTYSNSVEEASPCFSLDPDEYGNSYIAPCRGCKSKFSVRLIKKL